MCDSSRCAFFSREKRSIHFSLLVGLVGFRGSTANMWSPVAFLVLRLVSLTETYVFLFCSFVCARHRCNCHRCCSVSCFGGLVLSAVSVICLMLQKKNSTGFDFHSTEVKLIFNG